MLFAGDPEDPVESLFIVNTLTYEISSRELNDILQAGKVTVRGRADIVTRMCIDCDLPSQTRGGGKVDCALDKP